MKKLTTDEIVTRSETAGSSARRRMELRFPGRLSQEMLNEIQHQAELAYLAAVKETFLTLGQLNTKNGLRVA